MHIETRLSAILGALLLSACVQTPTPNGVTAPKNTAIKDTPSFVGSYSGNSFETAMGMRINEDGTFQWRLSVGALDMQAKGTWKQEGDTITLTSDPKPVPPRFAWSGYETVEGGKLIKVVWAETAKPFAYASVTLTCADGSRISAQVPEKGWSPDPQECAKPVSLILRENIYEVRSTPYNIVADNLPEGTTIRFVFERNDLGVADFTGMIGRMDEGRLKFTGGQGIIEGRPPRPGEVTLELRKLTPRAPETTAAEPAG